MKSLLHIKLAALAGLATIIFSGCSKENNILSKTAPPVAPTEEMVLTPEGYMAKSNVHFLGEGYGLHVENGRLQKVELKTGNIIEDFGEVKQNGVRLDLNRDPSRINNISPVVPEVQGWIAYAYWSNAGSPVTSFTTNWTVPAVPTRQGNQTIFLFNGMQDGVTSSSYIIQPVLQWGSSAAGGGKYWAVTNWYVTSSTAVFGKLVKVSTGAALSGVMKQTAVSGSKYNYSSSFTGSAYSSTNISVTGVPQANWLAETLESYGVTRPGTQYPNQADILMSGINITGPGITNVPWSTAQASNVPAPKATVPGSSATNGTVEITF